MRHPTLVFAQGPGQLMGGQMDIKHVVVLMLENRSFAHTRDGTVLAGLAGR
jgi:phospholipase C